MSITEKTLDATNKVLDLTNKAYDDVLHKPAQKVGDGLEFCLSFIGSFLTPAMSKYIQNSKCKTELLKSQIAEKYQSIPLENRSEPRVNILGPATDLIKYNLDEEHIRNIFVNLISNEMDKTKQNRVLPSYIEIAKQLSAADAEFLSQLYVYYKTQNDTSFAVDFIQVMKDKNKSSFFELDTILIPNVELKQCDPRIIIPEPIILDNLSRLEIIRIVNDRHFTDETAYIKGFEFVKNSYSSKYDVNNLQYKPGILIITDYGLEFLKICLSNE